MWKYIGSSSSWQMSQNGAHSGLARSGARGALLRVMRARMHVLGYRPGEQDLRVLGLRAGLAMTEAAA